MMGRLFYNNASSTDITRKAWLLRVIPYVYSKEKTVAAVKPKAKTANRSSKQIRMENFFRSLLVWIAVALVLIVLGILVTLVIESIPSIKALGIKYLWGKTWDPVNDVYGAWPFLIGTLLTSFTALIISIPFSFAVAIFLGEYYPDGWLSNFLKNAVELIAAVPSVIYGFWGFFVLVPHGAGTARARSVRRTLRGRVSFRRRWSWPSWSSLMRPPYPGRSSAWCLLTSKRGPTPWALPGTR